MIINILCSRFSQLKQIYLLKNLIRNELSKNIEHEYIIITIIYITLKKYCKCDIKKNNKK